MAQNPKTLRILKAWAHGEATRVLEIECMTEPFGHVGGKYVIVNTGVVSGDKPVKRAYSLAPAGPGRARVAVKRIGQGSEALHAAPIGTELSFSGPWGKLVPEAGLAPRTLVVATDTGITAALGVVETAPVGVVEVLWLRADDEAFLDVDHVAERIASAGSARFVHATIPPAKAAERIASAMRLVEGRVRETGAGLVLAAGDGAVVHPLTIRLAPLEVRIECFFHNPERKIAS
jgi:ferredoxin-NADP reductase